MMTLLLLAARNLRRNRARTALTFAAVFIGVFLTVALRGVNESQDQLTRADLVKSRLGAIQVHVKGYGELRDNQPIELNMQQGSRVEQTILATPGVSGAAPRLIFGGLVSNGHASTVVLVRGVDPVREYEVLPWSRETIRGEAVTTARATGAVLGQDLATALGIKRQGTATLQATTILGQQNAFDIELAGTTSGNALDAKRVVYVPLAYAQNLLRMSNQVTEYIVAVEDMHAIGSISVALQKALGPGFEVTTWEQLDPTIADMMDLQRSIIDAIGAICLAIVSFGVMNTMRMSVLERTREIGTMMALGMRCKRISLMFVQEAVLLSCAAALLGVTAARMLEAVIALAGGVPTATPGTAMGHFTIYPRAPLAAILMTVVCAVLGAAVAAALPAWRASQLRPVDALADRRSVMSPKVRRD